MWKSKEKTLENVEGEWGPGGRKREKHEKITQAELKVLI